MPDPIFDDPRLARIYDTFDGERRDLEMYAGIVEELGARRVLDVGCGTGTFALMLARQHYAAIGLDPAGASLAVAKAKAGSGDVVWLNGNTSAMADGVADLATMTGNVAQVFVSDDAWNSTLADVRRAVKVGGHLVFETRRRGDRAWEEWARDQVPRVELVPGVGEVEQRRELMEVSMPFVSFRLTYRFRSDQSVVVSDSKLRFRTRTEIEASLVATVSRPLTSATPPIAPGESTSSSLDACSQRRGRRRTGAKESHRRSRGVWARVLYPAGYSWGSEGSRQDGTASTSRDVNAAEAGA